MGGHRPGPVGTSRPEAIDEGTLSRTTTPLPASTGVRVATGAVAGTAKAAVDPAIEALQLRGAAKRAAYALKKKHPSVRFTSGRRNKEDQARAMASNVVLNRKWIEETYVSTAASRACQSWVNKNPGKVTKEDLTAGLVSVLSKLTDSQLAMLSKHLSGDAFDVQPVEANAAAIKKTIRQLPGVKFLEKEGGLVRWHAQF